MAKPTGNAGGNKGSNRGAVKTEAVEMLARPAKPEILLVGTGITRHQKAKGSS